MPKNQKMLCIHPHTLLQLEKKAKLLVVSYLFKESKMFSKLNPKRRSTFQFKYKEPKIGSLKDLISKLTLIKLIDFVKNHGKILEILNENMD